MKVNKFKFLEEGEHAEMININIFLIIFDIIILWFICLLYNSNNLYNIDAYNVY